MEKRYLIGRVNCEEDVTEFMVEYYVVEKSDLYSIELVKEPSSYGAEINSERETSFPISPSRKCVEKLAKTLMKNAVTPTEMYECLDDLYEAWYE